MIEHLARPKFWVCQVPFLSYSLKRLFRTSEQQLFPSSVHFLLELFDEILVPFLKQVLKPSLGL